MDFNDFKNAEIPKENLRKVVDNREYNKTIIAYYDKFQYEAGVMFSYRDILKKIKRISICNKFWMMDVYKQQKIKDFQKTTLCKDKFCSNCKKVKQASRMARFIPEIEPYKDNLFHMTLTLPNVVGTDLKYTYDRMAKSFKALIRFISCIKKIKDLDFNSWGYIGAIRSLEITFKNDSYHPHFHIGLIMQKEISKKNIENKYSWNHKSGVSELQRLFSEEEILIQKIWRLLLDNKKVTKENIENLEIGYSCTIDKFSIDDYAELFKYMTKETDEKGNVLTYQNFINLLHGLYGVHQLRGYGCLHHIKNDEDILEDFDVIYQQMIHNLRAKENPTMVSERPQDLISDSEYMIISRKSIFKYLREL